MIDRRKQLLILLGFFATTLGLCVAVYFVFFRSSTNPINGPPTVEPTNEQPTNSLPTSINGQPTRNNTNTPSTSEPDNVAQGGVTNVTRLTPSAVVAATRSSNGNGISYYDPSTDKFYTVTSDGETKILSDRTFPNAETIVWDDAANNVAIEFPDGSNIIYNFVTQDQTSLPKHWENFDFSPDGTQVAAKSIGDDPSARAIVITNTDASNTKVIAALGTNADKVDLNWSPNDQVIAFSDTGGAQTGFSRKMILPIGKNSENFKGLVVEGINFHATWTPDGSKILYDVTGVSGSYKPTLWIVDGTAKTMGDNRRNLGLNTWVEKCTFADNTTLYCAVPLLLEDNAGLQPALVTTNDAIYKIALTSGKVTLVAYPETGTQMSNLIVSTDGRKLFYTDSGGRVQEMRLK